MPRKTSAAKPQSRPDFSLESAHEGIVCGVDEAGRGPWAGPVVAAAAVLDGDVLPADLLSLLDDSKKLSRDKRAKAFDALSTCDGAVIGVGIADVAMIDRLNILLATFEAMAEAVSKLQPAPAVALVDGNQRPPLACPVETVVKGDGKSLSIAAASIVAKETRDRMMAELARAHPEYGWDTNMGYGTAAHAEALARFGPTLHHRMSFAPVRRAAE